MTTKQPAFRPGIRFWLVFALLAPCTVVVIRWTDAQFLRLQQPDRFSWDDSPRIVAMQLVQRLFLAGAPVLCATSLLLALGLRWQKTIHAGWASPGRVAVLVTLVVFSLYGVQQLVWWWFDHARNILPLWYRAGNGSAMALLAAWTILLTARSWRSAPGPVDLFGRILGLVWLAVSFGYWTVWAICS